MSTIMVEDAFMIKRRGLMITVRNPESEPAIGQIWLFNKVEWHITAVEKFDKFLCKGKVVVYGLGVTPSEDDKLLVSGDVLTLKTGNSAI